MVKGQSTHSEAARFEFGRNWSSFLKTVSNVHVENAKTSLQNSLRLASLQGLSFLDAGCGSGLFSLAALHLGSDFVYSFDFDKESVACAARLAETTGMRDPWRIERGSILDEEYLGTLGQFDIVYSWGVVHHTGNMWLAISNLAKLVKDNGFLFISVYNDQGLASRIWRRIKLTYNRLPSVLRFIILLPAAIRLWGPRILIDLSKGNPLRTWNNYHLNNRGMSAWHDIVDWVGGFPFEVAKPEEVFLFLQKQNFVLWNLRTVGGRLGCNEFVFRKTKSS